MPGGLPGVSQEFTADASGYVAAIQVMIGQNRDLIKSIGEVKAAMDGLGDKTVTIDADTSNAIRKIADVKAAMDGLGDKTVTVTVKYLTVGEVPDAGDVERTVVTRYVNVGDPGDAGGGFAGVPVRDAAAQAGDSAAAAYADAWAARMASGGGGSKNAIYDAMNSWGPQGGAGGGFIGGLVGGRGGGGGGGVDPFAIFPAGSAGADANAIVGFVKRWWTPVHFAIMGTNEILATAGPALAAAGAAAMVGWQGVEQMQSRYTAISATAESLGPAYGKTLGSYLGTGSALQNYQNLATGGVYELAGAGINLARQGGGAFGQTGLNTIAMLDRGVADMQINMQNRGTMGELSGLLGGGTGYLRQFGDIGANLGDIILGLAPHLPGVGGDYISALEGATGGLAGGIGFLNQHHLGDALGGLLATEAGWRVGKPMVGLAGRGLMGLGGLAGKIPGLGFGGMTAADIGDIGALTGVDLGEGALGLGAEGLAGMLTGGGAALGMLGGPEVGGLALSAFAISKLISSMPSSSQRQMDALQQQVYGKGGFTSPWQALGGAVTTATGLAASAPGGWQSNLPAGQLGIETGRFGPMAGIGPSSRQIYENAANGFAQTMGNLINSGPQLQHALQKAGLKGVSMADAFQIAQNSLLDLSHAFDSHGKLTKTAQQMLTNYVSTIGPMTQSAGGFNAAIAAQQIMSTPAMQNLSKVNQAMDSMTTIMTGTNLGASGLSASTAALTPAVTKALGSVTSPGSAAAWNTFASSSSTAPGIITQLQSFNDQMRTNLTLGSSTLKQAQGMTGYEIQQSVQSLGPGLKKDPAALAMLMQQAAQQGIGGYYQGGAGDAAKNYAALEKSLKRSADSAKQMNADSTAATIKNSQIPTLAKQFVQGTGADIQSQQIAKAAQDAMNIKGGINIKANVSDLVSQLRAAGMTGGAALKQSLDAVLAQAGVSKAQIAKINVELTDSGALGKLAQIKAALAGLPNVTRTVDYNVAQALAGAHSAAIAGESVPNIVRYITYVVNEIYKVTGSPGGVPYTPAGIAANAPALYTKPAQAGWLVPGYAGGGMVPGFGSGDHVPALLEPGEAVVPRYLVPLIAPILKSHHVPGFAAGGIVPAGTLAGVNSQISGEWKILDALYAQKDAGNKGVQSQINEIWKTILDPLYKAKDAFTSVSKSAASTAASTKAATTAANTLATSIANKFTSAMNYARGVSGAASAGQGFGNTGLLSGVDTTQTTVGQYMSDYLTSEKGFTKDLGTLTKGGLNKSLIQQLVAAGPVQGDLLAQSILQQGGTTGGAGGISQINSLWKQIGAQSHALGAQAAMSVYGQTIAPNLRSGTVTSNNIVINVSAPGGAAGNLPLTPAQIKTITEEIQAKLLQQAKRNRQTGLKLKGYGA